MKLSQSTLVKLTGLTMSALFTMGTLSGCSKEEPKTPVEKVEETAKEVGENAKDMADDAANEVEDLCEKAKENVDAKDTDC